MSKPTRQSKAKRGMSLDELNAKFNPDVLIPNKIRAALKQLGNSAVDETEFRKLCGTGNHQLSLYAGLFEDHIIVVRENGRQRRLWAGTAEFAASARDKLGQ